jgi:hypothetical protein
MLIQEAIKSKKPFKRIFMQGWWCIGEDATLVGLDWGVFHRWCDEKILTIGDILADDWEIKES